MRDYIIVTEADCELPWEYAEQEGLPVFEMPFTLEGVEYNYDLGKEVKIPDFFEKLASGSNVTTSCRSPLEVKEFFQKYLDEGKDVLYIGLSNELSMHFRNCETARSELLLEYPDARIELVDTLSISLGEAQLIVQAIEMKKQGATLDEVKDWVVKNIQNSLVFFVVDDLNYLKRGGRLSGASAFFGTVLDIKPILHTTTDGKLEPFEKVKGKKKALRRLAELVQQRSTDIENSTVYITAADEAEAKFMKKLIQEAAHPKDTVIWAIGPVIGGHVGPGTIGISFFGNER